MATGDVAGKLGRVVDALTALAYPFPVSARGLRTGDPATLLPLLHFALLDAHPALASSLPPGLGDHDDLAFVQVALSCLRSPPWLLSPGLSPVQLLTDGGRFVERKLMLVGDVLRRAPALIREEEARAVAAGAGWGSRRHVTPFIWTMGWSVHGCAVLDIGIHMSANELVSNDPRLLAMRAGLGLADMTTGRPPPSAEGMSSSRERSNSERKP